MSTRSSELSSLSTDEIRRLLHGHHVTPGLPSDTSGTSVGTRFGHVPLLGQEVLLDDNGAAFVLVFPCEQAVGGSVDTSAVVQDPMQACRRIFLRRRNSASASTLDEGFELLRNGPVRAGVYHAAVRAAVLRVLVTAGFTMESFPSVDGDEVFLKIGLCSKGETIRRLAQHFSYQVPFKESCYKGMPGEGVDFPGDRPMMDDRGKPYVAYAPFSEELLDEVQDFRHIDVVRIAYMCLDEWMDLNEMKKQNIVCKYFPAVHYDQMMCLHRNWGSLSDLWKMPSHHCEDDLRDYLGETVTFFFRWLSYYCHALVPLSCVGLVCALRRLPWFDLTLEHQRYIQLAFSFTAVVWASLFQQVFDRRRQSCMRRWGMKDLSARFTLDRAEYRPELEGTCRLWFQRNFAELLVATFCLAFVGILLWIEQLTAEGLEKREAWAVQSQGYITVAIIKIVSFLWTHMAPAIVNMKNHRTENEHVSNLTRTLAIVKIFVALFPFVNLVFLKRFFSPVCNEDPGASLARLAFKVYSEESGSWPKGIDAAQVVRRFANGTVVPVSPDSLAWLEPFAYVNRHGQQCLFGCYPDVCHNGHTCVTNCMNKLEMDLWSVFIVHIFSTLVLSLVIPILCTKLCVLQELQKVNSLGEDKPYTLLQFQAKCSEVASYTYMSWGGSQVKDMLEFAIGFALLTSFGIALPSMSVLALLSGVVEYHLLAFRMTSVTCRPICHGSDGIGVWEEVFDVIGELAVVVNVGMAVFSMHPMRGWSLEWQLAVFLFLEHLMLGIRKLVKFAASGGSFNMGRVDDFNSRFLSAMFRRTRRYAPVTVPPEQRQTTHIDLSLGPGSERSYEVLREMGIGFL